MSKYESSSPQMVARDLDSLFRALVNDAEQAAILWHDRSDPFARRVYLRAAFTLAEGVTQLMKGAALVFDSRNRPPKLNADEIMLLREEEVTLKDNGRIRKRHSHLRLLPNFHFSARCYAKVRHVSCPIDTSGSGWEAFRHAQTLRNRITHPRSIEDMELSIDDMRMIEEAMSFVRESTAPLLLEPASC